MSHPTEDPSQIQSSYEVQVVVRFAETDANGHMSHLSPVVYMEQARCELLGALGLFLPGGPEANRGRTFVLVKQALEYKRQAYYLDKLRIQVGVSRIGRSSLDMAYRIEHAGNGSLIATGTSTNVYFDIHRQKSIPLPEDLPERLAGLQNRNA